MKHILALLLLAIACLSAAGQTPLLERRITLSIEDKRLDEALIQISAAGRFIFSYSPAILDGDKVVRYNFVDRSVREILDEIFKGTVQYKARGKYIILTAAERAALPKEPAIVAGYVVDEATGERLRDVSIYDPVTLVSTVTDAYGYFEIKIDKPSPELLLSVNRRDYTDTLVSISARDRLLNIPIKIEKERISVFADSVGSKLERFWKKKAGWFENSNIRNVDDTLYRKAQVSFVPYLGTNHRMSGHVINDYSFNVLGGYAFGVNKLEFGGVFNLVRSDVEGFQLAGVLNGVGGQTRGLQFAGVINSNLGTVDGIQLAGVMNVDLSDVEAVQFAGVGNITEGKQTGPQVAGVFNISTDYCEPLQLAGVYNVATQGMNGVQVAGVLNVAAKDLQGVQVAGVLNIAGGDIEGSQVAGVLNFARKVKGTQIGLINVADTVAGVPVGFMSLVRKGYHKIEISADEVFYNNLSFRTGVRQFYTIFTAAAKPSTYNDPETFWAFGYGAGTAPRLSRKLFLNVDLTTSQIMQGNSINALNLLNKVFVGLDYQIWKKVSLAVGATWNGHLTEKSADTYVPLFAHYHPHIFYNRDFGSRYDLRMWLGGKVGIRFL